MSGRTVRQSGCERRRHLNIKTGPNSTDRVSNAAVRLNRFVLARELAFSLKRYPKSICLSQLGDVPSGSSSIRVFCNLGGRACSDFPARFKIPPKCCQELVVRFHS